MDWTIRETPVRYLLSLTMAVPPSWLDEQKVLYRSDTHAPLSVVSGRYQVVQPRRFGFYRDLSEISGFELETAGVLKAGRKFWALARTGKENSAEGNDVVKGLLVACQRPAMEPWQPRYPGRRYGSRATTRCQ